MPKASDVVLIQFALLSLRFDRARTLAVVPPLRGRGAAGAGAATTTEQAFALGTTKQPGGGGGRARAVSVSVPTTIRAASASPSAHVRDGEAISVGFGGGPSYVPTGLTASEYAAIKERENVERGGLDLGAWGPRFCSSGRPGGDWMVDPTLWTAGFRSQSSSSGRPESSTTGSSSTTDGAQASTTKGRLFPRGVMPHVGGVVRTCRGYVPTLIAVFTTLSVLRAIGLRFFAGVAAAAGSSAVHSSRAASSWTIIASAWMSCLRQTVGAQGLAVSAGAAVFLAPWVDTTVMEAMNRRFMWSRTRSMLAVIICNLAGLVLAMSLHAAFRVTF